MKKEPSTVLASLPKRGAILNGRYELHEELGSGARGVVFRATLLSMERDVAIKFLLPSLAKNESYLQRFLREIDIATRFNHPSIIRVIDVYPGGETLPYIVMELLHGRDLKEILDEEGALPFRRVIPMAEGLLDGLAEAHSHNIAHRDIKPANLFIAANRRGYEGVKILDFGIARLLDPSLTRLTATGSFTGTPAYMPPEVFIEDHEGAGKSADVYAAALVILELFYGRRVIPRGRIDQTLMAHLASPVPLPRKLAETPLGDVLSIALKKHPGDRFSDGEAFFRAFTTAMETTPEFQLSAHEIPEPLPAQNLEIFDHLGAAKGVHEKLEVLRHQEHVRVIGLSPSPVFPIDTPRPTDNEQLPDVHENGPSQPLTREDAIEAEYAAYTEAEAEAEAEYTAYTEAEGSILRNRSLLLTAIAMAIIVLGLLGLMALFFFFLVY